MRTLLIIATSLGTVLAACSATLGLDDDCLKHCWRHLQEVPDVYTITRGS